MENFSFKDGEWAYCVLETLQRSPDLATEKMSIEPNSFSVLDPDAIFILNDDDINIECNFPQLSDAIGVKYEFLDIDPDFEGENEFYDLVDDELEDVMNKTIKYCQKLKSPQSELEKILFEESQLHWDRNYK